LKLSTKLLTSLYLYLSVRTQKQNPITANTNQPLALFNDLQESLSLSSFSHNENKIEEKVVKETVERVIKDFEDVKSGYMSATHQKKNVVLRIVIFFSPF
jgi:hypothetical protein